MKLCTVEPFEIWLKKLKGKECPIEEYPKSVRRTLRHIDRLAVRPTAVIRFDSRAFSKLPDSGLAFSNTVYAWLDANATGHVTKCRGSRVYLSNEADAAFFRLSFMEFQ
jgi:hypothetical protein